MGRTDKFLIPVYKKIITKYGDNFHFYGSTPSDKLACNLKSCEFFDIQMGNWDINGEWNTPQTDKAICLRSSGFSINPNMLIENFANKIKSKGILIIDWTMGSDHYQRDSKDWTWGWHDTRNRCYGEYNNKKYPLYSSYLSDFGFNSSSFKQICKYAITLKKYENIKNWEEQVRSEFMEYWLSRNILEKYFKVLGEVTWTPIEKNGRAQLYLIQTLQRK